ncbi:hypothetical protein [Nocardia sp. NPDC046763]|uniref:hypothetical protein n=1 Tax=Nocardia sp. NPDC046763 TaxID=3155256 RepID=UPI0033FDEF1A
MKTRTRPDRLADRISVNRATPAVTDLMVTPNPARSFLSPKADETRCDQHSRMSGLVELSVVSLLSPVFETAIESIEEVVVGVAEPGQVGPRAIGRLAGHFGGRPSTGEYFLEQDLQQCRVIGRTEEMALLIAAEVDDLARMPQSMHSSLNSSINRRVSCAHSVVWPVSRWYPLSWRAAHQVSYAPQSVHMTIRNFDGSHCDGETSTMTAPHRQFGTVASGSIGWGSYGSQ